jgi:hypothetical protein
MLSYGPVGEISNFLRLRPKGLLHHYTTATGLIGMFETRTIWATSINHLNDSEEYVHALKILRKLLEASLDGESGDKKALFEDWLKDIQAGTKDGVFVASFSEMPDLLSQWPAYADCDNAYSVGFNAEEFGKNYKGDKRIRMRSCEMHLFGRRSGETVELPCGFRI